MRFSNAVTDVSVIGAGSTLSSRYQAKQTAIYSHAERPPGQVVADAAALDGMKVAHAARDGASPRANPGRRIKEEFRDRHHAQSEREEAPNVNRRQGRCGERRRRRRRAEHRLAVCLVVHEARRVRLEASFQARKRETGDRQRQEEQGRQHHGPGDALALLAKLRRVQGLNVREIAAAMGVGRTTVKRALRAIRRQGVDIAKAAAPAAVPCY